MYQFAAKRIGQIPPTPERPTIWQWMISEVLPPDDLDRGGSNNFSAWKPASGYALSGFPTLALKL